MKLTTKQLKKIIREELEEAVRGGFSHDAMGSDPSAPPQTNGSAPTPNEENRGLFHKIIEKLLAYDENAEWLVDELHDKVPQPQNLSREDLIRAIEVTLQEMLGIGLQDLEGDL